MANQISIELVGWRNIRGRFAALDKDVAINQVQEAHNAANSLLILARGLSPVGAEPAADHSVFRDDWQADVLPVATGAEVTFRNVSPHADFVFFPTRPHRIPTEGNRLLRWTGGKYGAGPHWAMYIKHPGTKGFPNLMSDILDRGQPALELALNKSASYLQVRLQSIFTG